LPEQVLKALEESNLEPTSLILEITESSAMENAEQTIRIFEKLRKIGVSISIDDFGTGYSSLSYLHRLPFDSLKIDRSFVSDVNKQTENAQILQTIVSLAQNLNLRTVAEGIETVEQLKVLQDLRCDLGQGFLFSKPLPKNEIENLLYEKSQWLPQAIEDIDDANLTYDISQDNLHVF
jgi:EAL domain-containing protein (putative c-di-GMP-specific phosphodiesterase class I)